MPEHTVDIDENYKAESDVRTLTEANKIRKDKKRLARATKMARKQLAALKEVDNG